MTTGQKLRTALDDPVPADVALKLLKDGNRRFLDGRTTQVQASAAAEDWRDMVQAGQSPFAAVMGCADSRCPVEILFDAKPGDIFVCRNAGNTCTHAEGSMVGSLEFCVGALRSQLILVLGHTQCGALKGATKAWSESSHDGPKTALDSLLQGLIGVADAAARDLGPGARQEDVANHAVKINVMQTVEFLLKFSNSIRDAVRAGTLQIHGAVYHIETGEVEFMGPSPRQFMLLQSQEPMPPVLYQRVGAPAVTSIQRTAVHPQATYVQAPTTSGAVPVQVHYPTYSSQTLTSAPVVSIGHGQPLQSYTTSPTVLAPPLYSMQNLAAAPQPAAYPYHAAPPTYAATSAPPPMTGGQFVNTGLPTGVYR